MLTDYERGVFDERFQGFSAKERAILMAPALSDEQRQLVNELLAVMREATHGRHSAEDAG